MQPTEKSSQPKITGPNQGRNTMHNNRNYKEPVNDLAFVNEHLSNDRTFLAWLSASVAIMVFGFVVIKFSLFASRVSLIMDIPLSGVNGFSTYLGIALVALGLMSVALSWFRYLNTRKQLRNHGYIHSTRIMGITAASVFLISLALVSYLLIAAYQHPN